MSPLRRLVPAAVLAATLAGCGDDEGDRAAFCAAVAELRQDDPFAELAVASPEDMRDAFAELSEEADGIADAAPPEARPQARRYAAAIGDLVRELSGAGFDPRRLDALRYREATGRYTEAAVSLDNAADDVCS